MRQIDEAGERAKMKARKPLGIAAKVIWGALLVVVAALSVYACIEQNTGLGIGAIGLLAFEVASVCDVFFGKWKIVNSTIGRIAEFAGDKAKDKERERLGFLFE